MAPSPSPNPLYLDTPDAVDRFADSIRGAGIIALDTEGASFHRFVDRIYLIQLATRERSAVIDPVPIGRRDSLGSLLQSRDVEVVLHDADYDLRLLAQDYGWHPTNIFDTRIAAQLLGIKSFGLAALVERFFGVKLDKKHQRADWSMRPLTPEMLEYAAQDTRYLIDLRERLGELLERAGRASWAAEEFARLEGTRWDDEDEALAFMRVKGARDLTRRELALLRELVVWRDGVARDLDRATFRVVSNEALLEIARQAPRDMAALRAIRGMPRTIVESRGREILAAVEQGNAVSADALPRFARPPRWDRDPEFEDIVTRLKAVRDEASARLDLDPGVLFPRERLEAIARRRPTSVSELALIPDVRRWQVAVLGDAFVSAIGSPNAGSAPRQLPRSAARRSPNREA